MHVVSATFIWRNMGVLSGLSAAVTGSTSGIGLGIARRLAAAGANILMNGIEEQSVVDKLLISVAEEGNVKAIFHPADMSKANQVRDFVGAAEREFGKLDILVNNAGIQHTAPIENFPEEVLKKMMEINLLAPFFAIQTAFPGMKERGFGRIVNIASVHGLVGSANKSGYCTAKHGLVGLGKVVALEGAEYGITCNTICPGWVLTPLIQKQIDDAAKAANVSIEEAGKHLLKAKQPMQRFALPEEVGDTVVFLSCPSAQSITGTALEISGGWTAQ